MLKSFFLSIVLCLASMLLIAEATVSSPLPQGAQFIAEAETTLSSPLLQETQSPEAAKAKMDVPESPEKSAESNKVDSSNSSQKAPEVSVTRSTYSQPPHPYDTKAIKKFDAELYGEGN